MSRAETVIYKYVRRCPEMFSGSSGRTAATGDVRRTEKTNNIMHIVPPLFGHADDRPAFPKPAKENRRYIMPRAAGLRRRLFARADSVYKSSIATLRSGQAREGGPLTIREIAAHLDVLSVTGIALYVTRSA